MDISEFNEILNYCINIRRKGASYDRIFAYLDKKNIDKESRQKIINQLDTLDREIELIHHQNEIKKQIQKGTSYTIIGGIGSLVSIAWIIYAITHYGILFYIQIFVGIVSVLAFLYGLLMIITGIIKRNEKY